MGGTGPGREIRHNASRMTARAWQDCLRGKAAVYAPILRKASATVTIGMLRVSAALSA